MLRVVKLLGISSLSFSSPVNGGQKQIIDNNPIQLIGSISNALTEDNSIRCLESKSSKDYEHLAMPKSCIDRSKLIEEIKLGKTDMLLSICNDDFSQFKELQNNILMASKISEYPRIIKKAVKNCINQNSSKNYSYSTEIFISMILVFVFTKFQYDLSISDPLQSISDCLNKYQIKKDALNTNFTDALNKFESERTLGGIGFKKVTNEYDINYLRSNRLLSETIQMLNENIFSFFSLDRKERRIIILYLKDPDKFLINSKLKKERFTDMYHQLENNEFSSIYKAKMKIFELYKFLGMNDEVLIKEEIATLYHFYAKLSEKFPDNITQECWISLQPLNLTGLDNTGRHINSDVGKKALMAGNKNFNGETLEIIPDPIFDMVLHNYKMNGFI